MKLLNKNNRAYLEIQTHRKNPIGVIRSAYKDENGNLKRQTIARITGVGLSELKAMQAALQVRNIRRHRK